MPRKTVKNLEDIDDALGKFEKIKEHDQGENAKFIEYLEGAIADLTRELRIEVKKSVERSKRAALKLKNRGVKTS